VLAVLSGGEARSQETSYGSGPGLRELRRIHLPRTPLNRVRWPQGIEGKDRTSTMEVTSRWLP
jgi:hypothetical protein